MSDFDILKKKVLNVSDTDFDELALSVFHFQAQNCHVYNQFLAHLKIDIHSIASVEKIPCLPISLFKNNDIYSINSKAEHIFISSGTGNEKRSKHLVFDLDFYHKNCQINFENHFGSLKDWVIIAILPSYLEQKNASLISMMKHFIEQTGHEYSGYYTVDVPKIHNIIKKFSHKKVLIFGVTYAILELASNNVLDYKHMYIMETGGMKGRGKELIREDLHVKLNKSFKPNQILSEYGMTELCSQAYSLGNEIFHTGQSMRVMCRNINDPLEKLENGSAGGLNFIDLANIHTCSFIASDDIGKTINSMSFKVSGRIDNSEIRGCNLLSF